MEIALKQIIIISKDLTSVKQMMGMVLGSLHTEKWWGGAVVPEIALQK